MLICCDYHIRNSLLCTWCHTHPLCVLIVLKTSWGFCKICFYRAKLHTPQLKVSQVHHSLKNQIWRWFTVPRHQKCSVSGVTCFLSFPLLPQYWRVCPSQPALLNAAHGSFVKPTSVTTPTASPSPLMPRLSRCLLYASWPLCMQHDACHLPQPLPLQRLWTNPGHHWLFVFYLRRLLSGDRSQPNLFAWHRATRWKTRSCTAWQHILCVEKICWYTQSVQTWLWLNY